MKNIVIIKTGDSIPSLVTRRGDFEDWIIAGIEDSHPFSGSVVPVHRNGLLPDFDKTSGIIITGSHAMVTDQSDWIKKTAHWILKAVKQEIPVLGICFGHQILAYALGGRVGYMPGGPEYGTVRLQITDNIKKDPLFGNLPRTFSVQESHFQSVTKLPSMSVLLGSTEKDPHASFRYGKYTWGVQFHPEYDADIANAYVDEINNEIKKTHENAAALPLNCSDTVEARTILTRFAELMSDY